MKQNILRWFIGLWLCIFAIEAMAQPVLIIDKEGKAKRQRYHIGDKIWIKTHSLQLVSGQITNLDVVSVEIDNQIIDLDSIAVVYKHKRLLRLGSDFLWKGGAMYFVLDVVNSAIVGAKPVFSSETALLSAGLITSGIALRQLSVKRYKFYKKWRIRVVVF